MIEDLNVQPHDDNVEQVILGIMLSSSEGASRGLRRVLAKEFYAERHRRIFVTIEAMYGAAEPTDVTAVANRLTLNGQLASIGGLPYLADVYTAALPVSQLDWYAEQLTELYLRRALMDAAAGIHQRASLPNGLASSDLLTHAVTAVTEIGATLTGEDEGYSAEDLMADPPGYDWVIDNVLERGERLILTGGEGAGKTTLTRQLAVRAAAGRHPFTMRPQLARRVMVVDCENSERLTMRRYGPLLRAAAADGTPVESGNFRLESHPGGLDLAHRVTAAKFLRAAEKFGPDLLVVGPLYRLHCGDLNDERDARHIAQVLDQARLATGAALLVEAHAAHLQGTAKRRALRPAGSSLWMRWPDFGYGIRYADEDHAQRFRVMDLEPWRGSRDERSGWPKRIRAGGTTSPWPWVLDEDSPGRAG